MSESAPDPEVMERFKAFPESVKCLMLATEDTQGFPVVSVAPFYRDEQGAFWLFISELSEHTQHLLSSSRCSLMLVADEADSPNVFARERLSFNCDAAHKDRQEHGALLDAMQERLGQTMSVLRQLGDFHLFCLTPTSGQYVVGFGQAYRVGGEHFDRLEHISVK